LLISGEREPIAFFTSVKFLTSKHSVVTSALYSAASDAFKLVNRSSRRPVIMILQPFDANMVAMALPNPEVAPVIKTVE
jgi:hypothetical protein